MRYNGRGPVSKLLIGPLFYIGIILTYFTYLVLLLHNLRNYMASDFAFRINASILDRK